jgi:hypothetical protein
VGVSPSGRLPWDVRRSWTILGPLLAIGTFLRFFVSFPLTLSIQGVRYLCRPDVRTGKQSQNKGFTMSIRYALTVPTKDSAGKPIPKRIRGPVMATAAQRLATTFGGFTGFRGRGGWIGPDGSLMVETVTVLTSFGERTADNDATVRHLAEWIGVKLNQSCVMVELGHDVEFIEPVPVNA